jgi:hypothetical protein
MAMTDKTNMSSKDGKVTLAGVVESTEQNTPAAASAISDEALDDAVGGITFTAPGDVAGVKPQRPGDGSVRPKIGPGDSIIAV